MKTRKMLAAIGAVILAAVSTAALVRYVQGAEDRAVAGEELVEVLVASTDIKAGTAATDLAASVKAEMVQAKVRPADAVTSFSQIEGLVTSVDLVAGEQLLSTRFVNPGRFQGARSATVRVPEGANEVTFKLAPERALGGLLRPGDTVSVVASFEPFDSALAQQNIKSPNVAHVILNQVMVVRVQFPEEASSTDKEKNGVGVAPTEDLFVTLAVDQPSLERAVFAAEFGKVWLAFEPKGSDNSRNREVTRGNVYEGTESLLPEVIAPAATAGDA